MSVTDIQEDRFSADDILGTVEVPLADLMSSSEYVNKVTTRRDTLGDGCPGTLEWSVGYMTKTTLQHHIADAGELTDELKAAAEVKLREAKAKPEAIGGIDRQKDEDLKEMTDEIIARTPPSSEWPSGIISVRVEQITGLEVPKTRDSSVKSGGEEEESSDLPSAYCTIIINNERVYKTRTKMKSNKPYVRDLFSRRFCQLIFVSSMRELNVSSRAGLMPPSSFLFAILGCTRRILLLE